MAKTTDYIKTMFFILIALQVAPPLIKNLKKQYLNFLEPSTKVAYLPIKGVIYDSHYYTKYLKAFFKDPSIKAVLLRIESPGSAAGSAEAIALELDNLKKEFPKPIIALSENICTSGAYYIAACADYIITTPSAFVGSIGTQIPYQFKLKEFIEQFKIYYQVIKAGEYKAVTDPFAPISPEQVAYLQALAEDSYQNFVEHIAHHRSRISASQKDIWANGKIFTGRQALTLGLIDAIGSRSTAVNHIKKVAIIEDKIEWVEPPTQRNFMSLFTGQDNQEPELSHSIAHALITVGSAVINNLAFMQ